MITPPLSDAALIEHIHEREEMQPFPMMRQGGSTLLWQLIDDMRAEHLAQRDEMARLATRLSEWQVPEAGRMLLSQLRESVRGLFADLDEHMQVEDDDLLRRFDTDRPLRSQDARRPRD